MSKEGETLGSTGTIFLRGYFTLYAPDKKLKIRFVSLHSFSRVLISPDFLPRTDTSPVSLSCDDTLPYFRLKQQW